MIHCDFCGLEFDPACTVSSCQGCPLMKACSKITCPRCGYQMLPEAWLVQQTRAIRKKLPRLLPRKQPAHGELADLNIVEKID
jgi:hypothetical protein